MMEQLRVWSPDSLSVTSGASEVEKDVTDSSLVILAVGKAFVLTSADK